MYLFRDDAGRALYVGKSVSIRTRARAHFAPSTRAGGLDRPRHDRRLPRDALGARRAGAREPADQAARPPGNIRLARSDERLVYIRCRLDIAFPILEVAPTPAAGHAVTIGPLRGRRLAQELVEQLDSLFGLRHCGRRLPRREHPSAYGQMGRCLSPCLGDLDPNLYRRRLDEALGAVRSAARTAGDRLLGHVERQMRAAAAAAALRARRVAAAARAAARRRSSTRLDGVLEATHARPRLLLARAPDRRRRPTRSGSSAGGCVDWGPAAPDDRRARCSERGRRSRAAARAGELGAHVPPDEVDEMRIVASWLASHPETPQLPLDPPPDELALSVRGRDSAVNGSSTTSAVTSPPSPTATAEPGGRLAAHERRARSGRRRGESATLVSWPTARSSNRQLDRRTTPAPDSRSPRSWRFGLPR